MKLSLPRETEGVVLSAPGTAAASPSKLLIVSESEQPHVFVHHQLKRKKDWAIHSCFSSAEAIASLGNTEYAVVLCDRDLVDGSWVTIFQESGATAKPARFILFCRFADVALWAEVLNLGAYDLLMYPFDSEELARVTSTACASWAREGFGAGRRNRERKRPAPGRISGGSP